MWMYCCSNRDIQTISTINTGSHHLLMGHFLSRGNRVTGNQERPITAYDVGTYNWLLMACCKQWQCRIPKITLWQLWFWELNDSSIWNDLMLPNSYPDAKLLLEAQFVFELKDNGYCYLECVMIMLIIRINLCLSLSCNLYMRTILGFVTCNLGFVLILLFKNYQKY